jgi:hypothetical protein
VEPLRNAQWEGRDKPSGYTPAAIAVETTATRFKVSARQTFYFTSYASFAIFRATGVAP